MSSTAAPTASSSVFVHGIGGVSPAGWGAADLWEAIRKGVPLPIDSVARPGQDKPLPARRVSRPDPRPEFLGHARLRRASAISQYAVGAALEALGSDREAVRDGSLRLGLILCTMSGSVNYSRRFYDETLRDPATASPLIFPETVFNAPTSHLAALLESTIVDYTLVGDTSAFLAALPLAAQWFHQGRVEACLVVGAEEMDWLTVDAFRLFHRGYVLSEGAGALYLRPDPPTTTSRIALATVTQPATFFDHRGRREAADGVRKELLAPAQGSSQTSANSGTEVLIDTGQDLPRVDAAEKQAWQEWSGNRHSPLLILGQGLMAGSAWQTIAAVAALQNDASTHAALISHMGCNLQAIGARLVKSESTP